MRARVVSHRKAQLHGAEIKPGLDLRRCQSHRHTAVNAVEGDLLNARRDEPVDALVDDSRYGWEHSVLPHVADPPANRPPARDPWR